MGAVSLTRAEAVLDGAVPIHARLRVRAAAWLARAVLEDAVVARLDRRDIDTRGATMRSRLCCLRVLDPEVADDAEVAWWGLSRICHHHAFELTPTAGEVRHFISMVKWLPTTGSVCETG